MTPDQVRAIFREEFERFLRSDAFTLQTNLRMLDGRNIIVGRDNGTKIGTAADQKIGFYGKAPVVQQSNIAAPSGGVTQDAEARTAVGSILTVLDNLGFTA